MRSAMPHTNASFVRGHSRQRRNPARSNVRYALQGKKGLGSKFWASAPIQNLASGCGMKPMLAVDAKATEHILHRQRIGCPKHIDAAHLYVQDRVRSNILRVRRVQSEGNVADLGTKSITTSASDSFRSGGAELWSEPVGYRAMTAVTAVVECE